MRRPLLLASLLPLVVTACAMPDRVAAPSAVATPGDADARLTQLFAESDEANLRRNPLNAIFRGDLRYADRLGDYLSDDYVAAERSAAQTDLARLSAIDRAALTPTNRIAYDVFAYNQRRAIANTEPAYLAMTITRPLDHFTGFHTFYPAFASGQSAAPFRSVVDYENNISRHRDYARLIDQAVVRFREGMARGGVQPRLTVENMIGQLDTLIAQGVEESPLHGPVKTFPDSVPAAEHARLRAATETVIRDEILPAHVRLRDFLRDAYLPVARATVGLSDMPGGADLYRQMIEENTTLPLDAEAVHRTGLAEVARISGEMERIKTQVGFTGTLGEFHEFVRTDPRFQPASAQALIDGYRSIGERVDRRVREQFSTIPNTAMEIRPVEPYRDRGAAAGSYQSGLWDPADPTNNRPGIFYFNTFDLASRTTPGMETLYLHEAVPGHHFQISLAQENAALPAFMRFGGNTAFVEGWALYAETLWAELGVETDPYQRFGGLNDEMLRAMRLVVDTGLHAKGWSRDQAIQYMLDNSAMGRTDAVAEVERYIVMPAQALAYKTGQLTISRLKAKAEAALGERFDPRAFHAEVLMTGSLPLPVLERKIDDWIASTAR